ncbi:MAG: TatD family hydrolase [bacterium]
MFDTHAHLTDSAFSNDVYSVINKAFSSGISGIITIAINLKDSLKCIYLSQKYDTIYATAGVHPHEAYSWDEKTIETIQSHIDEIVALGEIGLDFHYNFAPKDLQIEILKTQLDFAVQISKPVVIHCREAFGDLKNIFKQYPDSKLSGVIHCFSGNDEDAKFFIKKGFFLSYGGIITFPNAKETIKTLKSIPVERVLLETDSPYLSPTPIRGKRNTPENIHYIYSKYSEITGIPIKKITDRLRKNIQECFRI